MIYNLLILRLKIALREYADNDPVGLEKDKFNREDLVSPPVGEFLIKKSDVRIMQAKLRNAGEEIVSLQTQIQSKDKQLNRLREWAT